MSRRRGLDGVDFDEANHEGGDFADFVADTSEQSSRLAYALTGDTELSARVETQAYADVGRRWTDLDAPRRGGCCGNSCGTMPGAPTPTRRR